MPKDGGEQVVPAKKGKKTKYVKNKNGQLVKTEGTGHRKPIGHRKKKFGQAASVDMVMHASGASGTDTRVGSREVKLVGASSIQVPYQDPAMDVSVKITDRSLAYCAAGVVLRAAKHGWLASGSSLATGNSSLYYAFRFLTQTLQNSVQGTYPTLQSAPKWFWELNAALLPKTERMKTGRVVYTGQVVQAAPGLNVLFPLGTGDYDYAIFWGYSALGGPTINGYLPLIAPAPYTDALGEEAIQAMFEYFEEKGLCRRSGAPDPKELMMTHDTSAFAAVYPEMGASFFNPCGSANTVQSERQINSPMFAKFATYQEDGLSWRGWHQYHRSAGTPFYLGARLTELFTSKQLRNKVSPIFKWFNFDEFFVVLALCLGRAMEMMYLEAQAVPETCPLTSQQVQIMLRQAMSPFFDNDMAQDLRLQDGSWIPFLPFCFGPNGISQGTIGTQPLLPRFLAENIRCCKRIVAKLQNRRNPALAEGMEIDLVPILGRPSPSVVPQMGQFTWGGPAVGSSGNVFSVSAEEVPVNLVDASVIIGPDTTYLDLNGSTQQLLVETWNEWIQNLSSGITGLVTLSSDRGCEALSVLPYTNFEQVLEVVEPPPEPPIIVGKTGPPSGAVSPSNPKMQRRNSVRNKGVDITPLRKKVGGGPVPGSSSDFFGHVITKGTSSTLGFTSELWKYQSCWVLPVALVNVPGEESNPPCYQTNVIEPFYLPASSSYAPGLALDSTQSAFPIVADRLRTFAVQNTKAWLNPTKSEMEEEFEELTKRGDGGFFTKLAGVIGESIGIQGSAKFMNSVGEMTGL